jgi:phosphate transport system protein
MPDKHLSSQFDADLNSLSSRLLEMGGLVESQISTAMRAFTQMDLDTCNIVIENEKLVNDLEIQIDLACTELIARRQPTARDLRLVMAVSKAITNLERAGDEAERVAKRTKRLIETGATYNINVAEIRLSGQMAITLLRRSLDAFARLDTIAAAEVVAEATPEAPAAAAPAPDDEESDAVVYELPLEYYVDGERCGFSQQARRFCGP